MNNVCIFSHDQVTYDITAIDSSSIKLWCDADIRLIVKTAVRNVRVTAT